MTRDDSKCRICRRTIYTHFGEGHAFRSDKLSLRGEIAEAYKKYYHGCRKKQKIKLEDFTIIYISGVKP